MLDIIINQFTYFSNKKHTFIHRFNIRNLVYQSEKPLQLLLDQNVTTIDMPHEAHTQGMDQDKLKGWKGGNGEGGRDG